MFCATMISGCTNTGDTDQYGVLNKLMSEQKFANAIDICNEKLKKTPDDAELLAYRGYAQLKSKQPQQAKADLQKAISIKPDQGWFYCELANAYLDCNQDKEALEALEKADKLVTQSDRKASILSAKAVAHLHLDDAKQAVSEATEAISLAPEQKYSYQTRAIAYTDLFEFDKAISDATKSIALDDKNPGAFVARAEPQFLSGHLKEAIKDCQSALALDPKYFRALDMQLAIELSKGNDQEALKIGDQLVTIFPKSAAAWTDKALCLFFMKDKKQAKAMVDKALSLDPKSNRALYLSMILTAKDGDKARALALAEQQKANQNIVRNTKTEALARLLTADYQKVIEAVNSALSSEVKAPVLYRLRAAAYERLKLADLAQTDMQKANEQGYSKTTVFERLITSL